MGEKRNVGRFIEEIDGSISFYNKQDPGILKTISIKTVDISLHGAKMITSQSFPVYSNLRLTLNLTGSNQVIKLDVKVIWVKKKDDEASYEMGVEFLHDINSIENLHKHLYRAQ